MGEGSLLRAATSLTSESQRDQTGEDSRLNVRAGSEPEEEDPNEPDQSHYDEGDSGDPGSPVLHPASVVVLPRWLRRDKTAFVTH